MPGQLPRCRRESRANSMTSRRLVDELRVVKPHGMKKPACAGWNGHLPRSPSSFALGRASALRADRARYRIVAERGRDELGMDAGAAGDHDIDVLGTIRDADVARVAGLGEPA